MSEKETIDDSSALARYGDKDDAPSVESVGIALTTEQKIQKELDIKNKKYEEL